MSRLDDEYDAEEHHDLADVEVREHAGPTVYVPVCSCLWAGTGALDRPAARRQHDDHVDERLGRDTRTRPTYRGGRR